MMELLHVSFLNSQVGNITRAQSVSEQGEHSKNMGY